MEEDDFLLTPGALVSPMALGKLMASGMGNSARKELRFERVEEEEEPKAVTASLPDMRGLLGHLLDDDDEEEESGDVSGVAEESEEEATERLLWALLGVRAGNAEKRPSVAGRGAGARVERAGRAYAAALRGVHGWAFGAGKKLGREGLAWGVEGMLSEYRASVVALEEQVRRVKQKGGELPRLVLFADRSVARLERLAGACRGAAEKGSTAELLSWLHGKWQAEADREAKRDWSLMLYAASRPFFVCLEEWICGHDLEDPFDELPVVETPPQSRLFGLRTGARFMPSFLSTTEAAQLLACGQHSHLLFQLVPQDSEAQLQRVIDERPLLDPRPGLPFEWTPEGSARWSQGLAKRHEELGREVLEVMRQDDMLAKSLSVIEGVCLMQPAGGGWLRPLQGAMEGAALDASVPQLQQLAELGLGQYASWARVVVWPSSVAEQRRRMVTEKGDWKQGGEKSEEEGDQSVNATVGQSLGLVCEARWPLSLLVPPEAMRAYALAFRRVLQYETTSALLGKAWQSLLQLRQRVAEGLAAARACRRLVAALQRHFALFCHGPAWGRLMESARRAPSLDQVMDAHSAHLRVCLEGLFLAVDSQTADAVEVVLDTCQAFGLFAVRVCQSAAAPGAKAEEVLREKQFREKMETLRGLLAAAVGALVQQLRSGQHREVGSDAVEALITELKTSVE